MTWPSRGSTANSDRCSRWIGRAGAWAVALGIGAAIANSPGVALADDGQSANTTADAAPDTTATATKPDPHDESSDRAKPSSSPPADEPTAEPEVEVREPDQKFDAEPPGDDAPVDAPVDAPEEEPDEPEVTVQLAERTDDAPDEPEPEPVAPAVWSVLGSARRAAVDVAAPETTQAAPETLAAPTGEDEVATATEATVSPLGTPEQIAAERLAAEVAASLPVQLMKLVLQLGWTFTAQQQYSAIGGPDQHNLALLYKAVDEYAMAAAFQQQILNSMNPTVVTQVAPPHTWYGLTVPGSRILYDNPDTIYRFMGVNKTSTYVITGRFTGERPADTTFSVLTGLSGTTAAVLSAHDLEVNPDGTFVVTVSGAPALPGQRNHLQLPSDATLIAVRNTLSDWAAQDPMSLSIHRTGGPPDSLFAQLGGFAIPGLGPLVVDNPLLTNLVSLIPPLPCVPTILRGAVTAVVMALGLSRESQYITVATTDPTTGQRREPNKLTDPTRNAEFLATQLQSAGYFQLADDQALVLTIDPGAAAYFVVPVTDLWTVTGDYWNQQTSLNIAQAERSEVDGKYTLVISPSDPGVANWVSTGGLHQGTISIRFQDIDLTSTHLPTVSSQLVALDQLPAVLPADIRYLTATQRAEQLAERKAAFNRRFAPYPQP